MKNEAVWKLTHCSHMNGVPMMGVSARMRFTAKIPWLVPSGPHGSSEAPFSSLVKPSQGNMSTPALSGQQHSLPVGV